MDPSISFRSESWEIRLPADWVEKGDTGSGELYFESADGTKGVYIATWFVPKQGEVTAADVAQTFRKAEHAWLLNMRGYAWEVLADESMPAGDGTISLTDSWAREQSYRIASKLLANIPIVVRGAFHDYLCDDFEASQAYFAPMIESLRATPRE